VATQGVLKNVYPPRPTHKNVATQNILLQFRQLLFYFDNEIIQYNPKYIVIVQLLITVKTRQRQAENMPGIMTYISTETMESPQEA